MLYPTCRPHHNDACAVTLCCNMRLTSPVLLLDRALLRLSQRRPPPHLHGLLYCRFACLLAECCSRCHQCLDRPLYNGATRRNPLLPMCVGVSLTEACLCMHMRMMSEMQRTAEVVMHQNCNRDRFCNHGDQCSLKKPHLPALHVGSMLNDRTSAVQRCAGACVPGVLPAGGDKVHHLIKSLEHQQIV